MTETNDTVTTNFSPLQQQLLNATDAAIAAFFRNTKGKMREQLAQNFFVINGVFADVYKAAVTGVSFEASPVDMVAALQASKNQIAGPLSMALSVPQEREVVKQFQGQYYKFIKQQCEALVPKVKGNER